MEYTLTAKGNGPLAKKGDRIKILYTGKFPNDTVFDASSKYDNQPLEFKLGSGRVIKGWEEIGLLLHGGDKVTVRIPPELGYGAQSNPQIPANSTLIFDMEVIDVLPAPTPRDARGLDTTITPSGLKIIWFEKHPENAQPQKGQTVQVAYSGFLMDGTLFDSSVEKGKPYSFQVGQGRVIKGWDEGIMLLRKGEKAKLIVPAALAYGSRANGPIPANSVLMFDVELVDFQ